MMQLSHLLVVSVTSSSLHIHMLTDIGTGASHRLETKSGGCWRKLAGLFSALNLRRKASAASSGPLSKHFVRGSLPSAPIDFRSERVEMFVWVVWLPLMGTELFRN